MEWKPIETAPKDGTEFLAFDARTRKFDVCSMVNISTAEPLWFCRQVQMDGAYGPDNDEFGHSSKDIRYWMPLPEPPDAR